MDNVTELLQSISEHKEKFTISENSSTAEKIRNKIMLGKKSNDDWLNLQDEVRKYIATNPPKEEIEILNSCCEMLTMICSAIRTK